MAPGSAWDGGPDPAYGVASVKPHKFHRLDYDGRRGSDLKTK